MRRTSAADRWTLPKVERRAAADPRAPTSPRLEESIAAARCHRRAPPHARCCARTDASQDRRRSEAGRGGLR